MDQIEKGKERMVKWSTESRYDFIMNFSMLTYSTSHFKIKSHDLLQCYIKSEESNQKSFRIWSESFQDSNHLLSNWSLADQQNEPQLMAISQQASNLLSNSNFSLTNHLNSLTSYINSLHQLQRNANQIKTVTRDKLILMTKLSKLKKSKYLNQIQYKEAEEELMGCENYLKSQLDSLSHLKHQIFKDALLIKLNTLNQLGESIQRNSGQAIQLLQQLSGNLDPVTTPIPSSTEVTLRNPTTTPPRRNSIHNPKISTPEARHLSRPKSIHNPQITSPEAYHFSRLKSIHSNKITIPEARHLSPSPTASISSQISIDHQIPIQTSTSQLRNRSSSLILPSHLKRLPETSVNLNRRSSFISDQRICSNPITQCTTLPIKIELPKANQFRLPSASFNDPSNHYSNNRNLMQEVEEDSENEEESQFGNSDSRSLKSFKLKNKSKIFLSHLPMKLNFNNFNNSKLPNEEKKFNGLIKVKNHHPHNSQTQIIKYENPRIDETPTTYSIRNHKIHQRNVYGTNQERGKRIKRNAVSGIISKTKLDSIQEENLKEIEV